MTQQKNYDVQTIRFSELKKLTKKIEGVSREGLVMLGCGGDLNEWIYGVSEELYKSGVTTTNNPEILWGDIYKTLYRNERTDLVLMFNKNFFELFNKKLPIWKLRWGDCSWISSYLVNFKD